MGEEVMAQNLTLQEKKVRRTLNPLWLICAGGALIVGIVFGAGSYLLSSANLTVTILFGVVSAACTFFSLGIFCSNSNCR